MTDMPCVICYVWYGVLSLILLMPSVLWWDTQTRGRRPYIGGKRHRKATSRCVLNFVPLHPFSICRRSAVLRYRFISVVDLRFPVCFHVVLSRVFVFFICFRFVCVRELSFRFQFYSAPASAFLPPVVSLFLSRVQYQPRSLNNQ